MLDFVFKCYNIFTAPCAVDPCRNNGVCLIDNNRQVSCLCPGLVTGRNCEICKYKLNLHTVTEICKYILKLTESN